MHNTQKIKQLEQAINQKNEECIKLKTRVMEYEKGKIIYYLYYIYIYYIYLIINNTCFALFFCYFKKFIALNKILFVNRCIWLRRSQ